MEKNSQFSGNQVMKHGLTMGRPEECLQLTGSQINLTSRSQTCIVKSPTSPITWKSRPCSAFPCGDKYIKCKSHWKRPMSADNDVGLCRMSKSRSQNYSVDFLGCSVDEEEPLDPNFKHCYTYMSSNLLRSLIRNPWNSECSESASNSSERSHSEKSLGCLISEMAEDNSAASRNKTDIAKGCNKEVSEEVTNDRENPYYCLEKSDKKMSPDHEKTSPSTPSRKSSELKDLYFQRWLPHFSKDEKIVRFSQEQKREKFKRSPAVEIRPQLEYNPDHFISPKVSPRKDDETSCSTVVTEIVSNEDPKKNYETFDAVATHDTCHYKEQDLKTESEDKDAEITKSCSSNCPFSCCKDPENETKYHADVEITKVDPDQVENDISNEQKEENELVKEVDSDQIALGVNDSTYDEIVTIINVLEQEETNSLLESEFEKAPQIKTRKPSEQLHDLYSYLEEVEKSSMEAINVVKGHLDSVRTAPQSMLSNVSSVPRLEDLLNKNNVELAHEVLTLKLQIEDQSSGIKLLQTTIAEMKEAAKLSKDSHEEEIIKIKNNAESAVQRHQKFIKQLLQEKKELNEKVEKLVQDLKSGEERYQRNLKTIEERHAIEIQRVKETQAVAEKLKREKWIDIKTQKIKEMTVKGLEPELSRMAARQQQEIADLRNLHRSELEAVELRATRRTNELLAELRTELIKDKEEAILRETNALRAKLEKQFEEERSKLEHEMRKLREERRREKELLENKETQMQDTYQEMRRALEREKERERQHMVQEFQEQIEALKRRHQNEIKSVRETLEIEKEAWMNNYKKQQNARFLEREGELHHQYKRERDRDIELVIERLENEATMAQQELTQAAENKFKRMKEKFEQDIREMEETEATLKMKLSDAKTQLLQKDDEIADLKSKLHHLQTDMSHIRKLCEEMSKERCNLKEIIAKEFEEQIGQGEKEKEELKNQIVTLKTNHILELAKKDQLAVQAKAEAQQELNQVYNKVKITISKKEEALEILREQHKAVLERCSHLEKMLENQRRNLLLK